MGVEKLVVLKVLGEKKKEKENENENGNEDLFEVGERGRDREGGWEKEFQEAGELQHSHRESHHSGL